MFLSGLPARALAISAMYINRSGGVRSCSIRVANQRGHATSMRAACAANDGDAALLLIDNGCGAVCEMMDAAREFPSGSTKTNPSSHFNTHGSDNATGHFS